MGLDILAFKNLTDVNINNVIPINTKTYCPKQNIEWTEKYFPGRTRGLDPNGQYEWEASFAFRAGSYTIYNWWRNNLDFFRCLVQNENVFEELINFPDNQGIIGPAISQKLYDDFKNNYNEAIRFSKNIEDGEYWISKYRDWMKAFEFASQNGAVDFH